MTTGGVAAAMRPERAYRHEAFFYASREDFLTGVASFVCDGLAHEEPTLVVLSEDKIDQVREALGPDADRVHFADMDVIGHNPARLIPAWHDFVDGHGGGGTRIRGVGEPIVPGRQGAELVEFQQHESLLNMAFSELVDLWLLCPYDAAALAPRVVEEARRSHPLILENGVHQRSPRYREVRSVPCPRGEPLPAAPKDAVEMMFDSGSLAGVRSLVAEEARKAHLDPDRQADLVLSVNEIAANSILYAGGWGILRIWQEGRTLLCEVRDGGTITDPLVGRMPPGHNPDSSRGLWVVNQLCDLVQVRSSEVGTVVRMHVALP